MSRFSTKDMSNGVHITFANGVTVSIQWHGGNYCANRNEDFYTDKPCENAEMAAWGPDDEWLTAPIWYALTHEQLRDDVVGWVDADTVAAFMLEASRWEV